MNSTQEAKLNMYDAVITHLDANAAKTAVNAALTNVITAFKTKVIALHTAAFIFRLPASGRRISYKTLKRD